MMLLSLIIWDSTMSHLKKYRHAPTHLFIDDSYYFFTGAVYKKKKMIKTPEVKQIFIKYLFHFTEKYDWELFEWVVLENHYHFLAKVTKSKTIPFLINSLHKTSAFHIMGSINEKVKPFWYQYWDRCIRNEKHYFETATYILYNPIKHGYVNHVSEYKFSSFNSFKEEDQAMIQKKIKRYRPDKIKYYKEIDNF